MRGRLTKPQKWARACSGVNDDYLTGSGISLGEPIPKI